MLSEVIALKLRTPRAPKGKATSDPQCWRVGLQRGLSYHVLWSIWLGQEAPQGSRTYRILIGPIAYWPIMPIAYRIL